MGYKAVLHATTEDKLSIRIAEECRKACKAKGIIYEEIPAEKPWKPEQLSTIISKATNILNRLTKGT